MRSIGTAYEELFKRVSLKDTTKNNFAKRAMTWVACAGKQLSITQFMCAVWQESKENTAMRDWRKKDLDRLCCGLLAIYESNDRVDLLHDTLVRHLRSGKSEWQPVPQRQMAQDCIGYLSLPDLPAGPVPGVTWYKPEQLDNPLKSYPLLRYASLNWVHHVSMGAKQKKAPNVDDAKQWLEDCLQGIFIENPEKLLLAFQVHLVSKRQPFPTNVTVVHAVCYIGEPDFLAVLRQGDREKDDQARDSHGKTALHWAILRKDKVATAMVKTLLEDFAGDMTRWWPSC